MMNEQRTFFGRLRTFVIVTLITVMVWLLAESRMVQTRTLEAQVVLTSVHQVGEGSSEQALVVRQRAKRPGGEDQVRIATIQAEGSAAGLDRFVRVLENRIELRIGREIPAELGIHTLDLRAILRQSPAMNVHGVIITEVSPETITVEVDELVTREFRLRVDMPVGVELDGVPRTDPAMIRVRAPSSVLLRVESNQAHVRIDPSKVAQLSPGRLETIPGVAVELPGIDGQDWQTQIEPRQVDVFVTLRTLAENYTIDRLPVQVLMAPGEIGRWRIKIDEADKDLINTMVVGPAQAIELLKAGEVVPQAFVTLTFEDLERQIRSKPAQILGLPSQCRVVSPEAMVNLTISPIELSALEPVESAVPNPSLSAEGSGAGQ